MGTNIETFNESVAIIFGELYKSFPIPIGLSYNDLAITLFKDDDEAIDHEQNLDVVENTILWLKNSGYIWYDTTSEMQVYGAVLSPKGLEVLKVVPTSLTEDSSIGESLISFTKEGTKETRASLIALALTEGYKLLTI